MRERMRRGREPVHYPNTNAPRRLLAIAFSLLAVCSAAGQTLSDRVENTLRARQSLESTTIAVHVRDALTGDALFSHGGENPLIPASNMKLLTTGAALRVLGPDAVFETRLGWDGDRIVVIGQGDPGLGDPALLDRNEPPITVDGLLDKLARAIVAAAPNPGQADALVLDARIFDDQRVHPEWPTDQLNKWYCAEVAGLNFHTNVLTFFLSAGEDGQGGRAAGVTPIVRLQPEARGVGRWFSIDNKAKTVAKGRHTAWVARAVGARSANEFTIFGDVRIGATAGIDAAVHNPPGMFGSLLAERLEAAGLTTPRDEKGRPVVLSPGVNETFDEFRAAAVVRTAMPDILERANTNSQNLYTEALLKRIGHEVTHEPGSWRSGAAVVRMLIADDLGPEHANRTTIDDGSGMSRRNRVAPSTLTAWLADLADRPRLAAAMIDSLPSPGEGTLRRRFKGESLHNHVYAKSGSINGVRCLSGYVIADTGHAVAFSVMVNGIKHGQQIRDALALHEDTVLAIDEWMSTLPPRTVERIEMLETDAVGG